jgi:hypothetical protein
MDEQIAHLKAGLGNVATDLKEGRYKALMRSLKAAADAYAATNEAAEAKSAAERAGADKRRAVSAFAVLVAVMDHLRDERLEAPFRFLFDTLEKSQRHGTRTKQLDEALKGARLAAAVDDLIEAGRISPERACEMVAKAASYSAKYKRNAETLAPARQLKELRESLMRGKARAEAVKLYKDLRRPDHSWGPNDERPAPYFNRSELARLLKTGI